MTIKVGSQAPEFTLLGTGGRSYSLSEFRGRKVVLVFYPGDDTPVCTAQLKSYTDDISEFEHLDAQVLAISPQGVDSHEKFAGKHGLGFPLLADTDKKVGEAYGILGPLGFYRRSVFVLDDHGIVRFAHRGLTGLAYQPSDKLLEALRTA